MSVALPAATAMSEMPAVTFSVRMRVSRYHCGVRSASLTSKSSSPETGSAALARLRPWPGAGPGGLGKMRRADEQRDQVGDAEPEEGAGRLRRESCR